jgi:hypothetical protein
VKPDQLNTPVSIKNQFNVNSRDTFKAISTLSPTLKKVTPYAKQISKEKHLQRKESLNSSRKSENVNTIKRNNSNLTIKTVKTVNTAKTAGNNNTALNHGIENTKTNKSSSSNKVDKIMGISSLRITERKENKAQIDKIYESFSSKNTIRTSSAAQREGTNKNKIISFNVSENKNYQNHESKKQIRSPSYGVYSQKKSFTPRRSFNLFNI